MAEFPAGATTTTVHIPFYPAFDQIPDIHVVPVDNDKASLRIVQAKPYGVRIDVKRPSLHTDSDAGRLYFAVIIEGVVS